MSVFPVDTKVLVPNADDDGFSIAYVVEYLGESGSAPAIYRVRMQESEKMDWFPVKDVKLYRTEDGASRASTWRQDDPQERLQNGAYGASSHSASPWPNGNHTGEEEAEKAKEKPKKTAKPTAPRSVRPLESDYDSLAVKIPLSPQLRKQLTDEHAAINNGKELVQLPRTPSVSDILELWVNDQGTGENPDVMAVIDMIRSLFQLELGNNLLYRLERYQYAEFIHRNPTLSLDKVYGAEHLLRFFVILPWFLSNAPLEEQLIHSVKIVAASLLEFMRLQSSTFFAQEYEPASPAALQDAGFST